MGEAYGDMEENVRITQSKRWWGIRPWKRHGLILTVGGVLYIFIGILLITSPPSPARDVALKAVLQIASIDMWGGIFILSGLLSIISSRWPPFSEKWGYMVLTGMSSGWGTTYLLGVLFFGSPPITLSQSVLWGLLAFMWWGISGLLNPEPRVVRSNEGH